MAALAADHENLELSAPIWPYISCRRTFAAWEACRLLSGGQGQGEWAARLRQETLSAQRDDGSWEGELPLTAQRMVELRALGLAESARPLTRAAEWLLAQDESPWCPGMFFLDNALVAEQTSIVRQRQDGGRDRFRKRLSSELSRVRRAAPLCSDPCGPRIMWPNALAIGSLVRCGYATHPRLRRALEAMRMHDWCECAYQHGTSDWRRSEPLSEAEIAVFEQACIDEYRSGGVGSNDDLRRGDASRPTERARMPRVAATQRQGHVEYALRTPNHLQGCELETTRALASVGDPLLRRFAEAHLWRFAGRQRGPDAGDAMGTFGDAWRYYTEPTVAVLSVFAQYDHPASRVAIHRALAWLASHQNSDGSWGKDEYAEEATLAVVQCLLRIREELPQGIAQALGTQSIRGYDGAC